MTTSAATVRSTEQSSYSRFLEASTVIFVGSFIVNALNYIFTLLMSRLMGVEAFGEMAALTSLLIVVSVPATALTMLMARELATHHGGDASRSRALFHLLRAHTKLAAGSGWVLFLALSVFIAHYLNMPVMPVLVFSLLIPLSLLSSIQSGALQGMQEFFFLSKQGILGTLCKLLLAVLFVKLGYSVVGVMWALVCAQAVSWLYGRAVTRRMLGTVPAGEAQTSNSLLASFFTLLLTSFLLALLSNIDVILAKHYLSSVDAGAYGALSTTGKILLYGVGAFITVLLPLVSAAHTQGPAAARRVVLMSLGFITLASVAAYVLFSWQSSSIVVTLFGARYAAAAPHLGMFALAMGFVSVATALINYFIAIRDRFFMVLLAFGLVVEYFLMHWHHASLSDITAMLVWATGVLCVLMISNFAVVWIRSTTT